MTVTRRIRRRGEHGISRKAIAQGRRNAPTVPVCSCACSYAHIARETAGAASTRRSLRPLLLGAKRFARPGRNAPRECGGVFFARHCERSEAIHSSFTRRHGLLRGACHRARIRATRWLAMTGLAVDALTEGARRTGYPPARV